MLPSSRADADAAPAAPPPPRSAIGHLRALGLLRLLAAASVLGIAALLGWNGGLAGVAATASGALALPWLLHRRAPALAADDAIDPLLEVPRVSGGRVGAEVMVSQVVPVWSKQLEITRSAANESLAELLESFTGMSSALSSLAQGLQASQLRLQAGALDEALDEGGAAREALACLLAPSQRAFTQRDAAIAQLGRCSDAMQELRQLGRRARELGKHTRLVAFNASIEAHRSGTAQGGGALAVADETRQLAQRMAEVGEQVERLVSRLDSSLSAERLKGEISDTTDDELELELQVQARRALGRLLEALGGAFTGQGGSREAAAELSQRIDALFVHFQFGDRLSQMLAIVGNDMQNFARWVAANPYATQSDAAEWLANLEASYTMDEQRAQHHGNVHIDRGSEVEFF